ncbi:MAG: phage tail tape measure protein [Clostridia bacterium]|nr:phage tail tape measure protein [Clostridia bacterium]
MPMNDDSMVKIIQALGLDYNPAITATLAFENRIQSLNNELKMLRAEAMKAAKDINSSFGTNLGRAANRKNLVDSYVKSIQSLKTELPNATRMMDQFNSSAVRTFGQFGTAGVSQISKSNAVLKQNVQTIKEAAKNYNIMQNEFARRANWFLTGTAFYGALNMGGEAITSISEVEMGITEIARVMEDSRFVFKDYRDELLQFAIDYGQSFEAVQDIALRWAQAGYNVKDSLELTKTSLLALNTAELDAANATESMIGIMAQWQMASSDLPLLLDKINKTADDFTVTSQDLVDGLLRSSGAAKIMGLSIDQTISLLTVMREASGRTGREVGNALNSILSYVQRPSSIDMFESLGISVFSDAAKTQFRSVMEIFQEVAARWGALAPAIQDGFVKAADDAGLFNEELANAIGVQEQWNDLQQRDLSQASAGVYRRNYFIGMIERLAGAQDVLNNMTDAAGYSQRENARTMETLEKQYRSFLETARALAVELGDSGGLEFLKGLTNAAENGLGAITAIVKELGFLPTAFATTLGALSMFKKEMQLLKYNKDGSESGMFLSINDSNMAVKALKSLKAVLLDVRNIYRNQMKVDNWTDGVWDPNLWQKATLAAEAFKTKLSQVNIGMKAIQVAGRVTGFVLNTAFNVGIGLAIGFIVDWVFKLANAQKEAAEAAKAVSDTFRQERDEITGLKNAYADIIKSGDLTGETKQRLKEIQDQLISTYKLEADSIDLVNGKYSEQMAVIDQVIAKKAEDANLAMASRYQTAVDTLNTRGSSDVWEYRAHVPWENNTRLNTVFDGLGFTRNWATSRYETGNKTLKEQIDLFGKAIERISQYNDLSNQEKAVLEELTRERNKMLTTYSEANSIVLEFAKNKAVSDFYGKFKDEINAFNEAISKTGDSTEALEKLKKEMLNGARSAGRLVDFKPLIEEMFSSVEAGAKGARQELDKLGASATEAQEVSVSDLIGTLSELNQTLYSLADEQTLSASQLYDLIDKYPALAGSIIQVGDAYRIEEGALRDLRDVKLEEMNSALQAEADKTAQVVSETLSRINAYGLEVSAIKDLESAKAAKSGLSLGSLDWDYATYKKLQGAAGLPIPYLDENAYNQAREASKQISSIIDLYASIEEKKKLLNSKSFGVSDSSHGPGGGSKVNEALQKELKALEHKKRLDQLSLEQEFKQLSRIKAAYAKSADEKMELEERIYEVQKAIREKAQQEEEERIKRMEKLRESTVDTYRKVLEGVQEEFKKAYHERMDLIDSEIDKLDSQKKAMDRSEESRDYSNSMGEFEKELAYWKVRTSEEARKKVAELNQRIAEEEHKREVELQKQAIDDKKDALETERENWDKLYADIEEAFSSHNVDLIAQAAAASKAAFSEWQKNYVQPLMNALRTGSLDQASGIVMSASSRSVGGLHDWGMTEDDYSAFMENGARWKELSKKPQNAGVLEEMRALNAANQALRMKYGRNPSLGEYPKFHGGGKVLEDGALVAKKGEIIFPPSLALVTERLILAIKTNPGFFASTTQTATYDNRRETRIDKVVHIENYHPSDNVDNEIFARQVGREIMKAR